MSGYSLSASITHNNAPTINQITFILKPILPKKVVAAIHLASGYFDSRTGPRDAEPRRPLDRETQGRSGFLSFVLRGYRGFKRLTT